MDSQRKKILIIDDEEGFCLALNEFLRMRGYATNFTTDPDVGIDIVKKTRPDLILLDINMPGKDGLEVLKTIKNDPRTLSIPVIMITALDDNKTRHAALNSYCEDFITKPVSYELLLSIVQGILGKAEA